MPNWVYNNVTIDGDETKVRELMDLLARPIPTQKMAKQEDVSWEREVSGEWFIPEESTRVISFWNLIAPPESVWSEYFTVADANAPKNNWYDWNVSNWGTKWDANDRGEGVETGTYDNGKFWVIYYFDTAWCAPDHFYNKLAEYCHEHGLTLQISWEEEQGFGQELETDENGKLYVSRDWDIPSSHADYVEQDKVDSCVCAWGDEDDELYDDCPREESK